MSKLENIINLASGIAERFFSSTVCIVGSGPAGVILAVDLANAGVEYSRAIRTPIPRESGQ